MYIYESHHGGFYSSEEMLDYDYLYCEQCGDSDMCLGYFSTKQQFIDYMEDSHYDIEYIKEEADGLFVDLI